MFALLLLASVLSAPAGTIERDSYGVPKISAPTEEEGFYWAGWAVAEDRLWQMELSRRSARGRLAEILGPSAFESDRQTLLSAYSDDELEAQFRALEPRTQAFLLAYARGTSDQIEHQKRTKTLPTGYGDYQLTPEPWTHLDSLAIMVRMGRLFGGGGAGELRNFALYQYLKTQPCKDKVFDVMDDLLWLNDKQAICTVSDKDDPLQKARPKFPMPTRAQTIAQLEALPQMNLLELLPAIRMATDDHVVALSESLSLPFKTGSYAMVVSPSKSKSKVALLLNGPQMGHTQPAVIHEMAIHAGQIRVSGMDVPGIPGVLVGKTPHLAWGLTTGVVDSTDIIFNRTENGNHYLVDGKREPIRLVEWTVRVKGEADRKVVQKRTSYGPILLESKTAGGAFSSRSSGWMKEISSFDAIFDFYELPGVDKFLEKTKSIPLGFNVFCADIQGNIGWRFCGLAPERASSVDPRFPTIGGKATDWIGTIPQDQMPWVINPSSGTIFNWNNKPVSWWPNSDTPAWGRIFRNELIVRNLTIPKIGIDDLERSAWSIARQDGSTVGAFYPSFVKAIREDSLVANLLKSYDVWQLDGMQAPLINAELVKAVRRDLFQQHVGSFISEALFSTAIQPSVVLNALEGRTKFNYLGSRTSESLIGSAYAKTKEILSGQRGSDPLDWRWKAPGFPAINQPPVPYSDRGSFIQIIELGKTPNGRSVLPPGNAESGIHQQDQVPFARAWMYKPMWPVR